MMQLLAQVRLQSSSNGVDKSFSEITLEQVFASYRAIVYPCVAHTGLSSISLSPSLSHWVICSTPSAIDADVVAFNSK